MDSNKYKVFGIISIVFLIISYSLILLMDNEEFHRISDEDGIIETCSALSFFISAVIMLFLYFGNSNPHQGIHVIKRNIFILLLGIFFFFCFGEEISWGQRIFNIESPDFLIKINNQGEINIHNLNTFQITPDKEGISRWITSGMLFHFFLFAFGVIIPILDYLSNNIRNALAKLSFPVVPLYFMPYFLLNLIIRNILENQNSIVLPTGYGELFENNYAILLLLISISFLSTYKLKRRVNIVTTVQLTN